MPDNGSILNYTINVNYPGEELLTDVMVTDVVPAGSTFVSAGQGGILGSFTSQPGSPGVDPGVPGASGTVNVQVGASSDDAEEMGPGALNLPAGSVYLSSSDLELVDDIEPQTSGNQTVGIRFQNITVPKGATITNAYLTFSAVSADSPNTNNDPANLLIQGQDADNAPTFVGDSSSSYSISTPLSPPHHSLGRLGANIVDCGQHL